MSTHSIYLNGNASYDDETGEITMVGNVAMPEGYPDPMGWWTDPESQRTVTVTFPANVVISSLPEPVEPPELPTPPEE